MASTDNKFIPLFKHKTLTRIHGEPDYPALKKLQDEVCANASKIQSDLGGGNHGHLGLTMRPPAYALVSPTPYIRPPHPGVLTIPPRATTRQETGLREDHKKATVLFQATANLDTTLKLQIGNALDNNYIDNLRDRTANTLQPTVTCNPISQKQRNGQ